MNDSLENASPADDFEVEVSALDADGETDAAFVAQPPAGTARFASARTRRLVIGCGVVLAALLALASVPALRGQALGLFGGAASPTPSSGYFSYAPLSSPQPGSGWVVAAPQPDPGWALAGPPYALSIAFAPSAPATGYTCGPQHPTGNQGVPLIVGVTRDAGIHWQTLSTPASAITCQITVDPTNALDVALLATPCQPCLLPLPTQLYRSFDGGLHWSLWSLPSVGSSPPPDLSDAQWVWVGSTLFIAPHQSSDTDSQRLAASVAGQAFVWLNTAGLFTIAPANANINELLASRAALYVVVGFPDCVSNCNWLAQSPDGGATWLPFNPTYQGQPVNVMAAGGDGRTLLGQVVRDAPPDSHIYLRSTDGGATWQMLGPRPDLLIAEVMNETPDGSIYAAFDQDPDSPTGPQGTEAALGIYVFAPGAADWRYVGAMPLEDQFIVAWDTAGHPVALWGLVDPTNPSAGLELRQL